MILEFEEYRAKKILNIHKHVDSWFWNKYGAHPYIGCRHGCEFCYTRGGYYLGKMDPNLFETHIRVKINAAELLRKELSRVKPDVIGCGDWQKPAEKIYGLSRKMLEIVNDLEFPLFVVERSPFILRDLDLLEEINRKSWVGVIFSLSNLNQQLKSAFEPFSPGIKTRFSAMEKLAQAGIAVGTSLMPVIPFAGDDDRTLEDVVVATKDHGGSFVLVSGLTMDGYQAERSLAAAKKIDPALENKFREFYRWPVGGAPQYAPPEDYANRLANTIHNLVIRHGIRDRIPRYIQPGRLADNKRIAEMLFLKLYDLELACAESYRQWLYRKAAWMVDEWPVNLVEVYNEYGLAGLLKIPGIGKTIGSEIGDFITKNSTRKPDEIN